MRWLRDHLTLLIWMARRGYARRWVISLFAPPVSTLLGLLVVSGLLLTMIR